MKNQGEISGHVASGLEPRDILKRFFIAGQRRTNVI